MNTSELSDILGGKRKSNNTMMIIVVLMLCCCCYCCSISSSIGGYFMMNNSSSEDSSVTIPPGVTPAATTPAATTPAATTPAATTPAPDSINADPKCTKVNDSYLCLGVEQNIPVCYSSSDGCNWANLKTPSQCSSKCPAKATSDTPKYDGEDGQEKKDSCTDILNNPGSDPTSNWVYQACKLTTPDSTTS